MGVAQTKHITIIGPDYRQSLFSGSRDLLTIIEDILNVRHFRDQAKLCQHLRQHMTRYSRLHDIGAVETINTTNISPFIPSHLATQSTHFVRKAPSCSLNVSFDKVQKYPIDEKSSSSTSSEIFSHFIPWHFAWKSNALYSTSLRSRFSTRSLYPLVTGASLPFCSDRLMIVCDQLCASHLPEARQRTHDRAVAMRQVVKV